MMIWELLESTDPVEWRRFAVVSIVNTLYKTAEIMTKYFNPDQKRFISHDDLNFIITNIDTYYSEVINNFDSSSDTYRKIVELDSYFS